MSIFHLAIRIIATNDFRPSPRNFEPEHACIDKSQFRRRRPPLSPPVVNFIRVSRRTFVHSGTDISEGPARIIGRT